MLGHVIVHAEGSFRGVETGRMDGRYVILGWGTLDEQIAEATAENRAQHTGTAHVPVRLWVTVEDCEHRDPDEDAAFAGVDDELDAWIAEHHPQVTEADRDAYAAARRAGRAALPNYVLYEDALNEYEPNHGTVCFLSPTGTCCAACTEGDDDFGFEPEACSRRAHAREAQTEFFALFASSHPKPNNDGEDDDRPNADN